MISKLETGIIGAVLGLALAAALPALAQERPNVVFILADNVGYGDMGPYGGGKLRGMPTPVSSTPPTGRMAGTSG